MLSKIMIVIRYQIQASSVLAKDLLRVTFIKKVIRDNTNSTLAV
jgi:hypothetical protein